MIVLVFFISFVSFSQDIVVSAPSKNINSSVVFEASESSIIGRDAADIFSESPSFQSYSLGGNSSRVNFYLRGLPSYLSNFTIFGIPLYDTSSIERQHLVDGKNFNEFENISILEGNGTASLGGRSSVASIELSPFGRRGVDSWAQVKISHLGRHSLGVKQTVYSDGSVFKFGGDYRYENYLSSYSNGNENDELKNNKVYLASLVPLVNGWNYKSFFSVFHLESEFDNSSSDSDAMKESREMILAGQFSKRSGNLHYNIGHLTQSNTNTFSTQFGKSYQSGVNHTIDLYAGLNKGKWEFVVGSLYRIEQASYDSLDKKIWEHQLYAQSLKHFKSFKLGTSLSLISPYRIDPELFYNISLEGKESLGWFISYGTGFNGASLYKKYGLDLPGFKVGNSDLVSESNNIFRIDLSKEAKKFNFRVSFLDIHSVDKIDYDSSLGYFNNDSARLRNWLYELRFKYSTNFSISHSGSFSSWNNVTFVERLRQVYKVQAKLLCDRWSFISGISSYSKSYSEQLKRVIEFDLEVIYRLNNAHLSLVVNNLLNNSVEFERNFSRTPQLLNISYLVKF